VVRSEDKDVEHGSCRDVVYKQELVVSIGKYSIDIDMYKLIHTHGHNVQVSLRHV
jgi:hypothetical protein